MGKIVTFWSPYPGKAKVTSSMCAILAQLGMNYPELDIAVSHTGLNDFSLEGKLDTRIGNSEEKQKLYKKAGVIALKVNYRRNILTSEKIRHSAIPLRIKSMFLYPNADIKTDEFTFLLLTEILKKEYDMVFLDLESGTGEESLKYLQASDFIVAVLPQDPWYVERFFKENSVFPEEKKTGILIGGYINTVKCGKRFLRNKLDIQKKDIFCGVIPVNQGFFDAMTEGKTFDFFYRNQRVRRNEENYEFIVQTKEAAENIRKKLFSA